MNLDKLYKMQEDLDKHIIEKHNIEMSKEELLDNTILALLVEVGELANTTRCFKHWSTKGVMEKKIVIEELADVLHFYPSIGNQLGIKLDKLNVDMTKWQQKETIILLNIYYWTIRLGESKTDKMYEQLGWTINLLYWKLGFSDKEVEQAVLERSQGLCEWCGNSEMVQLHHIINGNGKRRQHETVESIIALCYTHHHGTVGVHGRDGKELDRTLKIRLQKTYKEQGYKENEIRELMGGKIY